ncbi:MAG: hypothetical protein ABI592_15615 [Acidobacteriota bacterium]
MKRAPSPLAFHGIGIRAHDPQALARRCRDLLGWRTLSSSRREIVLGEGPELFLAIRPTRSGEAEGVEEIHLAVEHLKRSRRRATEDSLGGDSWSVSLLAVLALTMREFRRAPKPRWRRRRKKPDA